jgi:hypothetical protein
MEKKGLARSLKDISRTLLQRKMSQRLMIHPLIF